MSNIADTLPIRQNPDGAWQVELPQGRGWVTVESEQHAKTLATVQQAMDMAMSEQYDSQMLAGDLDELSQLMDKYDCPDGARFCKNAAADMRKRIESSDGWAD